MTYPIQNPITHIRGVDRQGHPNLLNEELEKLDRELGHDYVPMDLFIDHRTINEHFHESSIRSRSARSQA